MFQIITGITATNRITAIAAPRPSWWLRKNHRIIRSAITTVPFASAFAGCTKTMSKTFIALITM